MRALVASLMIGLGPMSTPKVLKHMKGIQQEGHSYVYKIEMVLKNGFGLGTGFFLRYKNHNYLITNNHVCARIKNGDRNYIEIGDKRFKLNSPILSDSSDLCAFKIREAYPGRLLHLSPKPLTTDQRLYVVGYPSGSYRVTHYDFLSYEATPWHVGKKGEHLKDICVPNKMIADAESDDCLMITMMGVAYGWAYGGNSGSPVLNEAGDVVGVLAGTGLTFPYMFFVPASALRMFLDQIGTAH